MYYNGAEGDQSPRLPPDGPRRFGSNHERAETLGRRIALVAVETYRRIKTAAPAHFAFALHPVKLPAGRRQSISANAM